MTRELVDSDGEKFTVWTGGRAPRLRVYISSPGVVALTPARARALAADLLAFADETEGETT